MHPLVCGRLPLDAEDRSFEDDPDRVPRSNIEVGLSPDRRGSNLLAEVRHRIAGPETDVSAVGIIVALVEHEDPHRSDKAEDHGDPTDTPTARIFERTVKRRDGRVIGDVSHQ